MRARSTRTHPSGLSRPHKSIAGSRMNMPATSQFMATVKTDARSRAQGSRLDVAILLQGSRTTQTTLRTVSSDLCASAQIIECLNQKGTLR